MITTHASLARLHRIFAQN